MATTLSQFYSDKGQALPSVSQRGSLAAQAGIQGYTGSAAQNNQLLNFMQTSGTGQTGTQNLQSIQPPTIPAGVALGNTQASQMPQAPQGTSATELGGASAGYLAMPTINSLNQLGAATQTANQNAQTAQNDYMSQFTGLLNQMQNRPGELEQQYQIQQLSQDAMKAKANYDSVELAYRRKKESAMNNTNLTKEQASNVISDIERKEASQKADIAIDYNLKQGLLSNAKELMNKQLELELEPMKLKVDFYKDNRDRFDKILDKTEMRQYDYIQKKEERAYQAAKESANRKFSLIEKAIDSGIYTTDMKNMSYDQIAERLGSAVAQSGDFAATLDTTASLEPATLQKSTKQQLAQLIATGDYKGAITRIQNSVSKGLTGENKTNFDSKRTALPAIDNLAKKLEAYSAAGGDTGILKGNVEDISAKLGKVNDPAFKQLATDLKISLQAYRQNVSGAAFSPQEAKEYASVNPTGNKSLNLNLSIINGMRDNFERQVTGTVDAVVGDGAKYIREYASYQGLPKEDAIVKYTNDNPDKRQLINEMMNVPGATIDMITLTLGIDKLIK